MNGQRPCDVINDVWMLVADDERHDPLAKIVIRDADDGCLPDGRMGQEGVFDLPGADLVPAALDDVDRGATDDPEPALVVDCRGVPRAEPFVTRPRRARR